MSLKGLLPPESLLHLAKALNSKKPQENAGAQWELAVVTALTQLGQAAVPVAEVGRRRVDLVVESGTGVAVGFEITALSNVEQEKAYGVDAFMEWFYERLNKKGLNGEWNFEFEFQLVPRGKEVSVLPRIPRGSIELEDFRYRHLNKLLTKVACAPNEVHSFEIREPDFSFALGYKPCKECHFSFNAGSSDDASFIADNALWRRLQHKADQIRDSGFDGPAVVVLCDAGFPPFAWSEHSHRVTAKKVCEAFFELNTTISGALLLRTCDSESSRIGKHPASELVISSRAQASAPLPPQVITDLSNLGHKLPILRTDGPNFIHHFANLKRRRSFRFSDNPWNFKKKGSEMSFVTKVSARGAIEALAKNPTTEDGTHLVRGFNSLSDMVKLGRRLRGVTLVRDEEADDDWIEFEFEEKPDPAVSDLSTED